ncbi:hypothetical protein [Streptomyces capoamus]|uniref:hypothetical protein n=1 Tax=Streptomyces capoamus TaxID=68183 RepID=UPI003392E410
MSRPRVVVVGAGSAPVDRFPHRPPAVVGAAEPPPLPGATGHGHGFRGPPAAGGCRRPYGRVRASHRPPRQEATP